MLKLKKGILIGILLACLLVSISLSVEAVSAGEKKIAKKNLKRYINEYGRAYLKSEEKRRIDQIFSDLAGKAKLDDPELNFKYDVIAAPVMNAAYLGAGQLVIFEGLINKVENDKQLAAIIAHELGHGVNDDIQDNLELIQTMQLGNALIDLINDGKINQERPGLITTIAFNLLQKGYSRKQEKEADRYSVFLTQRAGYDPQGTVEVMRLLKRNQNGPTDSELLEVVSDHPNLDNRIDYLSQLVNQLKQANQLYNSPLATARRFTKGLLKEDIDVIYDTYTREVRKQLSIKASQQQERYQKVVSRINQLENKSAYTLQLRNQVEGTSRVAISLSNDLVLAIDLIAGKYGWRIARGPFVY
ncbi:hypothetical protein JCM16358_24310 [Halanaerocella petrolearia]